MPKHTAAKQKAKANAKQPAKKAAKSKAKAKTKAKTQVAKPKAKKKVASVGAFGKGIKSIRDVKGKPNGKQRRKA